MKKGAIVFAVLLLSSAAGCRSHGAPSAVPPAPENLELDPTGPHDVALTWTPPASGVQTFVIRRSVDGNEYVQIGEAASERFMDHGVSPGATYVYQVSAANTVGESEPAISDQYRHPYLDACNDPLAAQEDPLVSFYDFPVSGLTYLHEGEYSITDANGAFGWDRSGDIPFSIGYVHLGHLRAGDKVGLRPLARNLGGDPNPTLTNLLRLFIALDEDRDATNGTQLPCELSLAYGEIDPAADYATFAQQETVIRLTRGAPLPSAATAQDIYQRSLFRDYVGHYTLTWRVVIDGILPLEATIPFDIDEHGKIRNTGESIVDATLDPHGDYRLKIVDLAALALSGLGYYKLEIHANIHPDQTIDGEVVLKGLIGDSEGRVWGGRE